MLKAMHHGWLALILVWMPVAAHANHTDERLSLAPTASSYWNAFHQKPDFMIGLEGTYHFTDHVSLAGQYNTAFTRGDLSLQLRLYPVAPHPLGLYFALGPHVLHATNSSDQTAVSVAGSLGLGTEFQLANGWLAAAEVGGVLPFAAVNLTELLLQVRFGKRF